jgi:PPOX class probable FMN-dependent enzyme
MNDLRTIRSLDELETIYGKPGETSLVKETAKVIPHYRSFIEASPFCALSTIGPEGMDCSPRGDVPGFVRVQDEETLLMPDRRGNNRVDSLRNIVRDPRVALCFLIPGSVNCLRVNGEAIVTDDADLRASFTIDGKEPRSVIVIRTRAVYFQCGRAMVRSRLWDPSVQYLAQSLPTPGQILAELSDNRVGGETYDSEWQGRALGTLW